MQRVRAGVVGTPDSDCESSKTLPNIRTGRSGKHEVTNYKQPSTGNRVLLTKFKPTPEETIAKYRNMAVKSYTINPADYSHNW